MASHRSLPIARCFEKEIRALGVDIRFEPDIRAALTPLTIGARTVGNRFAIHPMEGCDGTLEGAPDELTFRRWARFGAGGAKLLWGEAVAIDPDARANTPSTAVVGTEPARARADDRARAKRTRTGQRLSRRPPAHPFGPMVVSDPGRDVSRSGAAEQRPDHHRRRARSAAGPVRLRRRCARATSASTSSTSSSATDICSRRCSRRKRVPANTAAVWRTGRGSCARCSRGIAAEAPDLILGTPDEFLRRRAVQEEPDDRHRRAGAGRDGELPRTWTKPSRRFACSAMPGCSSST